MLFIVNLFYLLAKWIREKKCCTEIAKKKVILVQFGFKITKVQRIISISPLNKFDTKKGGDSTNIHHSLCCFVLVGAPIRLRTRHAESRGRVREMGKEEGTWKFFLRPRCQLEFFCRSNNQARNNEIRLWLIHWRRETFWWVRGERRDGWVE